MKRRNERKKKLGEWEMDGIYCKVEEEVRTKEQNKRGGE